MKIKDNKILQAKRLSEICREGGVDYDSMKELVESVKSKKLRKGGSYHIEKIKSLIEKK